MKTKSYLGVRRFKSLSLPMITNAGFVLDINYKYLRFDYDKYKGSEWLEVRDNTFIFKFYKPGVKFDNYEIHLRIYHQDDSRTQLNHLKFNKQQDIIWNSNASREYISSLLKESGQSAEGGRN